MVVNIYLENIPIIFGIRGVVWYIKNTTTIYRSVIMVKVKATEEFRQAVKDVLGDMSIAQAGYKTGVSYEYIRTMLAFGRIPSEDILEKFAEGMGADLYKLRVAAGYEEGQPEDLGDYLVAELRQFKGAPRVTREEVQKAARKIIEEADRILEEQKKDKNQH